MEAWASPCLHRRERCLVTRRISVGFARDPMEALESPSGASSIEEKRWRCPMADDDFEFRIGRSTADRSLNRELLIRSEEHTSELQSLMRISYAVFCLKNKKQQNTTKNISN